MIRNALLISSWNFDVGVFYLTIDYFDIKVKIKKKKKEKRRSMLRFRGQLVFFKQVDTNGNCLSEIPTIYMELIFFIRKNFLQSKSFGYTESRQRKTYKTGIILYIPLQLLK